MNQEIDKKEERPDKVGWTDSGGLEQLSSPAIPKLEREGKTWNEEQANHALEVARG